MAATPTGGRALRATLVTRIFTPEPAAASFRLQALVDALVRDGIAVDVRTVRVKGHSDDPGAARVRRWPVLRDREGYVRGYLQYLSFDVPAFFRLLLGGRSDVVVVEPPPTTGFFARIACALRRTPYVFYAADVWSDATASTGAPAFVTSLVRMVEGWVYRGAAHVVAVSDGVAERVHAIAGREVDVTVVRNGVDTTVFTPAGPRAERAPDGPYLIYAGTTSEWQGADVFVRAMPSVLESVPDATLVFLGQGSHWDELQSIAAALPAGADRVVFEPLAPPAQAARWLRGAQAAVVSLKPGLGYDFAFPTKIFAGVACGTPVVFAGPGPAGEMVRESELGLAVEYDVAAVAEAMVALLGADPDRERLAAWAVANASARSTGERAAEVAVSAIR